MTWETGVATNKAIGRLAAQVAGSVDHTVSQDEVLRRCVGVALSQDLSDDELSRLMDEVERIKGRPAGVKPRAVGG